MHTQTRITFEMTEECARILTDLITGYALEGMLFEVSATPKPGLVDRINQGAHRDMDFFTFMSSAAGLHSCFDRAVRAGVSLADRPIREVLPALQKIGVEEEQKMFSFTKGVNTHKGMIFTLGMLCGAAGWQMNKGDLSAQTLCRLVSEMCAGITGAAFRNLHQKEALTKGEKMYLRYGCTGARGEVEGGYQTVLKYSLPIYTSLREQGTELNCALLQALLSLIANTVDTNILSRHDWKTAEYARQEAARTLACGGALTEEGMRRIREMDEDFIRQYISPGGCADLLAVTHFLYAVSGVNVQQFLMDRIV